MLVRNHLDVDQIYILDVHKGKSILLGLKGYFQLKLAYLVLIFFVSNHRPVNVRRGSLLTSLGFGKHSTVGI